MGSKYLAKPKPDEPDEAFLDEEKKHGGFREGAGRPQGKPRPKKDERKEDELLLVHTTNAYLVLHLVYSATGKPDDPEVLSLEKSAVETFKRLSKKYCSWMEGWSDEFYAFSYIALVIISNQTKKEKKPAPGILAIKKFFEKILESASNRNGSHSKIDEKLPEEHAE